MNITITYSVDIKTLASFLEEMNNYPKSHVGYCGEVKEEIYDTLINDFSDLDLSQSFAVAYQGERMVGALGLDIDRENRNAEVWGPFIRDEVNHEVVSEKLWKKVISHLNTNINCFLFFLNKENKKGKKFVMKHGGFEKGNHLILKAYQHQFETVDVEKMEKYSSFYEESFVNLHETSFPNTYYSAQDIINRIDEQNQLLLLIDHKQKMNGYVYVEANPDYHEGNIEYIAVSSEYRKQGMGTRLIRAALAYLFSYEEIEEITLCVGEKNEKAIRLYQAAGFQIKHELIHFMIERSSSSSL